MMNPLVSADWLEEHINDENLVVLDASTEKNAAKLEPKFPGKQIKGARYFDMVNRLTDKQNPVPNMLAGEDQFTEECQRLGINQNSVIVVYDNLGVYNSPRAWWMFRVMGHSEVYVLNGGLTAWVNAGLEVQEYTETGVYHQGNFKASYQIDLVSGWQEVLDNIEKKNSVVLDARGNKRFTGEAPEPREGMRSGHIPGSVNLPYGQVVNDDHVITKEELAKVFGNLEIPDKPMIFSCGSGVTACIIMLAAECVNDYPKKIYDGSWAEWGKSDLPIETG